MEEILLSVAGIRSEMSGGGVEELARGGGSVWKIELPQGFQDPNIDGKGGLKAVGEEQDAVGDFVSDAGEFDQFVSRFVNGADVQTFQIDGSFCHGLRGRS